MRISVCQDVLFPDVGISRCQDIRMGGYSDGRMSRCEDIQMSRCEDILFPDKRMSRYEDVQMLLLFLEVPCIHAELLVVPTSIGNSVSFN